MSAIDIIKDFAKKQGREIVPKTKEKDKVENINSAAQQKELLLKIAEDLGYITK